MKELSEVNKITVKCKVEYNIETIKTLIERHIFVKRFSLPYVYDTTIVKQIHWKHQGALNTANGLRNMKTPHNERYPTVILVAKYEVKQKRLLCDENYTS